MRIEIVQLENIRSHVKSTVPFARGFNCLVGGLGCGKSSILYAIDFALFGDPVGRSYEYLLREGAETGKVLVEFSQNGKNYKICRSLKKRGKGISQDINELKLFEDTQLVASVKSDAVAEQIKAITGLDKELFREIVWVRQEHLKELLDAQPRERQKRLDGLFGLSDYEMAWNSLQIYQKEYEVEKRVYEKDSDVVGLEKLNMEYNRTVEQFSLIELELQDLTEKLTAAKKSLEEADLELEKMEEVRAQNEELKQKEARIVANLANLKDSVSSLNEKIEVKKGSIENLRQRLASMEAQMESCTAELKNIGISVAQPIETMRRYIATFDDQISSLKAEHEVTLKNMQADSKRISSLSEESRCPLCLQTLTEDYKNALVQRIQDENNKRRNTLGQFQHNIEELQQLKSKANTAFSTLQNLTPRIEDLNARVKEETEALTDLSQEFENKQKLEQETLTQLDAVHLELNRFDVSKLEAAKIHSRQVFQLCSSLQSELRSKEDNRQVLSERLNEIKDRVDVAQHKLERMEKIKRTIEIINSMREAYRSIQPKLRSEFVKVLRNFVQQILDVLISGEGSLMNVTVDENYTPYVLSEGGVEREVSYLSGGERTLVAFAYRLGLGQLIMQSKTGHGLSMLLLDEPTESLGREDGSIDRLAEAISRFKAIEQIIAVTHSEAFAEKAEHVIRLEKETGESKVSIER